jgi:inner membrane protein involved in colicin E2 resistance
VRSPFIKSTSEFRLIRVTIKDEYKEQLKEQEREQKRQKFLDYLFNSVDSSTEQKLSENEKKHFRSELMPATDFVCGYFNREQWTDLELRLAISTLKFLETKAVLVDDDKKFINRLLESLSNELNELNLTA